MITIIDNRKVKNSLNIPSLFVYLLNIRYFSLTFNIFIKRSFSIDHRTGLILFRYGCIECSFKSIV